ncbi:hypothetical protein Lser_V15G13934 [Lactuca serriola]
MAEIIISAFLAVAFEKLASAALKKLAHSVGIQSQLKKWERLLSQLHDLLADASQKEITNRSVKQWLNNLQHLAYDIDDILNDLATEAMHHELTEESGTTTSKVKKLIPTCCTSFSPSARMHGKLNKITIKLQDLVDENSTLGLTVKDGRSRNTNRRSQTSLVDSSSIVGRQVDKEALLHKLLGDEGCKQNFSIVPIVGMGGVGKTTLARLLYDEKQVKEYFELKAWVCVSDEFDIFNISNVIFQSIVGENKEFKDLNLLQLALKEKLSMKRFLLVLDDVWSESYGDWEIFARPFLVGAPGSKVIITTRKLSLLMKLGYDQPYRLSLLSHDDALTLFCKHALDVNNFDLHPKLRQHGEGIVKKCDGLPLALIALGRLLRTKTDEEEWEELLNSEIWRLEKGDEIVPALRLSYQDLSASLKQLFAYCSLFPKDYMFDKEELILLWMAEGFLHQSFTNKSRERLGHEYFEELLSRSFFQQARNEESLFVMHDLMNDLATSVAGDFFIRIDNDNEKGVKKEAMEKYRHMSFIREEYIVYKKFKGFEKAKSLRTFLSVSFEVKRWWQNFYFSNKILVDFLMELPLLRVLCLRDYEISELPESIGRLKHLRYLNLSRTRITHLPENVSNLYNLQTLIVSGCRNLKRLPNSFLKLKNLRHFDITGTPLLNKMPLGISELKSLQTLTKIVIGGDNGYAITELKNLKNLHGKFYITGLDQVQTAIHAEQSCLLEKRFSELKLEWNDVCDSSRKEILDKKVLNVLKPHQDNLKKLKILSYRGVDFPNWVGDSSFHRLTYVSIRNCKKCISLPPLGDLPSLKKLFIQGMDEVKVVGLELLGASVSFPSLEILSFRDMQGWEIWSTNSVVVDTMFPCLQELCIDDCPNLVEISLKSLPRLNTLKIIGCDNVVLTSLVHVASSIKILEMWHIFGLSNELWGGVMKYLGNVEEVRINWCNQIRYLWESEVEASKFLVNLRKLVVCECENLESLGENEEDNCGTHLTSLRILEVSFCKSMERCSCPGSIETLNISSCPSFKSIFFPTGGQKLKSLTIDDCQNFMEKEFIGGGGGGEKTIMLSNTRMPILEDLQINCWPNLKSIIDLSYFVYLTELVIEDCPNMESFPDHELPNLTLLKLLVIKNCPSTNASFPHGLWPPNLCTLKIGGLKKQITEWGPQNFPTSLVDLSLWGRSSEDVSNGSELSHLLPSSLTSFGINGFDKLESLSMELQHLTSLQHLFIHKCPKMIHLPKALLPSLLSLDISGCPNLNEMISRRGSYRRLISGIPSVTTI